MRIFWLFTVFVIAAAMCSSRAFAQWPVTLEKDVTYGQAGGIDLKMDIARPDGMSQPVPAIVCIHGGAWQLGSKNDYEIHLRLLASLGYVAAAVDYRLAPGHKWPAQIEDVKCAVRYLRAHAAELGIDPSKLAALGDSAGGHLALLLGVMQPKDKLEGAGGNPDQPSGVQAVINFAGPTDLRIWRIAPEAEAEFESYHGRDSGGILEDLLGTADRTASVMAQASPIHYVNTGDAPIITFHGDADTIVNVEQAKRFHQALDKAGIRNQLHVVENGVHGLNPEQVTEATAKALAFIKELFGEVPKPVAPPVSNQTAQ